MVDISDYFPGNPTYSQEPPFRLAFFITTCSKCGGEKKFTIMPSDSDHVCPSPLK